MFSDDTENSGDTENWFWAESIAPMFTDVTVKAYKFNKYFCEDLW